MLGHNSGTTAAGIGLGYPPARGKAEQSTYDVLKKSILMDSTQRQSCAQWVPFVVRHRNILEEVLGVDVNYAAPTLDNEVRAVLADIFRSEDTGVPLAQQQEWHQGVYDECKCLDLEGYMDYWPDDKVLTIN